MPKMSAFYFSVMLGLAVATDVFSAACPVPSFTDDAQVKLIGPQVLIVTHASTIWDHRYSAKPSIDRVVAYAKSAHVPVVYLQGNLFPGTYFYDDCRPTYYVASANGVFAFNFEATHVIGVGGNFESCQMRSVADINRVWRNKMGSDLRLTEIVDGIYTAGYFIKPDDPYLNLLNEFRRIFNRAFALSDMLSIINNRGLENDYLRRYLNSASYSFPVDYRIVVEREGVAEFIYRDLAGAPTLTIDFRTSLSTPF